MNLQQALENARGMIRHTGLSTNELEMMDTIAVLAKEINVLPKPEARPEGEGLREALQLLVDAATIEVNEKGARALSTHEGEKP